MAGISRARRAELQRRAQDIRRSGQRARWSVERIAAAIQAELPEILPLEAWRLAFGWSRRQVVEGVRALYVDDGLAPPPVNTSMLCRWEYGEVTTPQLDYCQMLARLYGIDLPVLGLMRAQALPLTVGGNTRYRHRQGITIWDGQTMTTADENAAHLAALRESIQLALEVEGPAGGSLSHQHLETAVSYYSLNFSAFAPAHLALEVHRTRALVGAMLHQQQSDTDRTELRRLAGWLSALAGNLAFILADHTAAQIHLGTAARLGTAVGESHLICWSLGAQSMTANAQNRFTEALDLARQALEYADTPLRRAQILAWGQLRSLANLGAQHRSDAARIMAAAQDEMAADPDGEQPGRFGFDHAELQLHLSEVNLQFGNHDPARTHAEISRDAKTLGGPGWAAATLALARAQAAHQRFTDAAALAIEVLDTCAPDSIRETSRVRLRDLDHDLHPAAGPSRQARDLHDRIRALPALVPVGRLSDEPNGT